MWRHSISLMSLDKAKINANRFGQKRDFGDPRKWAIVDTKGYVQLLHLEIAEDGQRLTLKRTARIEAR
ncbi:hypothetical protein HYQ46_002099 [Verticillium longisporum]|nr:hypothetical protein HYQ46_002099 [Verticillium longisporum]